MLQFLVPPVVSSKLLIAKRTLLLNARILEERNMRSWKRGVGVGTEELEERDSLVLDRL